MEALAGSGFDWMVIDCEHAANGLTEVVATLQALAPYPVEPVVRATHLNVAEIKRLLDAGARTILVPYVQTVEEAQLAAAAVAYPPEGVRGVAGATRASKFGAIKDYAKRARDEICLLVQVETADSLAIIEDIAAVEGVDGVFIGPADLGASLGHLGEPGRPEVRKAVMDGLARIRAAGKPAGFLTADQGYLEEAVAAGATFLAIDIDMVMLRRAAAERLAACAHWKA
jgi:4-hydroxy-2-oxoheptanedioate aldolase